MKNSIEFMQCAWFGDDRVTIDFPENWDIHLFSPDETDALNETEIQSKLESPVDSESLKTIVAPNASVLIICDDISRPTRTDLILPQLLKMLLELGIEKDNVSILISSGTHDLMNKEDISLKLGKRIAEEYSIHQHHSNRGNKFVGKTSRGTPVYIDRLLLKHDHIIGVGGIVPHNPAGFGGGAKLILGVCGIKTIMHFHRFRKGAGTGGDIDNEFRHDIHEAARMAGLNFIVNTLVNREREIIDLFSGDLEEAFNRGVAVARKLFGVPHPDSAEFDLVIADVYPFDASFAFTRKGWWPVMNVSQDCHKLILSAMPKGVGGHLIYPIPNSKRINKLVRLYVELDSFGIRYFFAHSLSSRINKMLKKVRGRNNNRSNSSNKDRPQGERKISFGLPGSDVCYLHSASGASKKNLNRLPYRLFDSSESYFKYMESQTGGKPLRVAIYRASALTFPT
ncbi:MAG: DUF2088 domain-containing protein [Bacteroidetes bacterium]|nr:DUF2088 domain-containing protein [Bacteroidota bacterium]